MEFAGEEATSVEIFENSLILFIRKCTAHLKAKAVA